MDKPLKPGDIIMTPNGRRYRLEGPLIDQGSCCSAKAQRRNKEDDDWESPLDWEFWFGYEKVDQ